MPPSSDTFEVPSLDDISAVHAALPQALAPAATQNFAVPSIQTFVTPAMWQESVASVYEGGLKRSWDYDATAIAMGKRL